MSNDPFDITGATLAITGGAGQLGQNFAASLAAAGARVAVLDLKPGAAPESESLAYVTCDVTQRASIEAALEAVMTRFGTPTGLVNAAAIDTPPDAPAADSGPFEDFPAASWDRTMDVNVKGVFQCCQVFGGAMAEAGRGSIINIASAFAIRTYATVPGYAASKAGVIHLTRAMAVELATTGIRVNAITPGFFDTELGEENRKRYPERRAKVIDNNVAMRRVGEHRELDGPLLLLASDAGSYITGENLVVDGGLTVNPVQ